MPKIAVILGSDSDLPKIKDCVSFLQEVKIDFEVNILSAHRLPDETASFCKNAKANGFEIIIAAAGLAAHLPGVCASHTDLPVIGIPLTSKDSDGKDALLSIVQMPPGVPVATVGINNSKNAAVLAAKILALKYPDLSDKLKNIKDKNIQTLKEKNRILKEKGLERYLEEKK
ncbi:MAG: 5-(carboxyamino)imidazole ribonucleotide mutase [Elusimicrobia bacterium]|nr:5-(carboxyamino)imidazole ribonucleotide mutase [Elusimicrobiota bacterium]